jgi:hypothetical protein
MADASKGTFGTFNLNPSVLFPGARPAGEAALAGRARSAQGREGLFRDMA